MDRHGNNEDSNPVSQTQSRQYEDQQSKALKMMMKMGWNGTGSGLGKTGQGIAERIKVTRLVRNRGLGFVRTEKRERIRSTKVPKVVKIQIIGGRSRNRKKKKNKKRKAVPHQLNEPKGNAFWEKQSGNSKAMEMMMKMGWGGAGEGLGKKSQGISERIKAVKRAQNSGLGFSRADKSKSTNKTTRNAYTESIGFYNGILESLCTKSNGKETSKESAVLSETVSSADTTFGFSECTETQIGGFTKEDHQNWREFLKESGSSMIKENEESESKNMMQCMTFKKSGTITKDDILGEQSGLQNTKGLSQSPDVVHFLSEVH